VCPTGAELLEPGKEGVVIDRIPPNKSRRPFAGGGSHSPPAHRGGIVPRMSKRFYLNCPLAEGGTAVLTGPEVHHLARVCRVRPGDAVSLFNGDGLEYAARVVAIERRQVILDVLECSAISRELPFVLELAAPLPKGDRAQLLVEKMTEIGVTRFVPLASTRSVIKPGEARRDKLQRHVIEASKQCGRNRLMEVGPVADWPAYSGQFGAQTLKVLAHPSEFADHSAGSPLKVMTLAAGQALVAVAGPEGGFTEEELALARAAGWALVNLGPRVLRVETAALVLAAWALAANELPTPSAH
jgi:16S rRNA (uracil1498-N3)-methyltransferase